MSSFEKRHFYYFILRYVLVQDMTKKELYCISLEPGVIRTKAYVMALSKWVTMVSVDSVLM